MCLMNVNSNWYNISECLHPPCKLLMSVAFMWFVRQVPNMPDMKRIMEWTHRLRQSTDANVIYHQSANFLVCYLDFGLMTSSFIIHYDVKAQSLLINLSFVCQFVIFALSEFCVCLSLYVTVIFFIYRSRSQLFSRFCRQFLLVIIVHVI